MFYYIIFHVFTAWQSVHICALLDYESLTHWPYDIEEFFTVYKCPHPHISYATCTYIRRRRINSHGVNLFFSHRKKHCLWAYKPLKLVTLEILVGWEGRKLFFFSLSLLLWRKFFFFFFISFSPKKIKALPSFILSYFAVNQLHN